MAKGQMRAKREIRKPKKQKIAGAAPAKPGTVVSRLDPNPPRAKNKK
jgi:hypothetical protein